MTISKVTATFQAQYTGIGDLNLYLYSPIGTRTKLLERNCGNLQNVNATFDDSAAAKFSDACPSREHAGSLPGQRAAGQLQRRECIRILANRRREQRQQ